MAIKFLFFIFILIFIASFGLFVTGALMFGPIDVGTILALICMIGTFAGMTTLEKIVTGKARHLRSICNYIHSLINWRSL